MSKKVEKILKDYPRMLQERKCVAYEIANFRGVTAEEVIKSMYTPHTNHERVQSSRQSDKTAQIAMNYKDKMDRINSEWIEYLEAKLKLVNDEIVFFEAALSSLSGKLPVIIRDLVIEQMTWNDLADKYFVSKRMIGYYRRKAIGELDRLYENHNRYTVAYMLS